MTEADDADKILAYFDALGLMPVMGPRGWNHMGTILSDAALQRRSQYKQVVEPRARELMVVWPDADTVSGFACRLATDDVSAVLRWRSGPKLTLLHNLTKAMTELGIETVADLRAGVTGENALRVRSRLRAIYGVGPKTVDYLAILAGSEDHSAIDGHVKSFAGKAGILRTSYHALSDTIRIAAARRGWTSGAIDASIWRYMSSR